MARTNVWMSVSDLMTGLMIIFLFIAISYMSMVDFDVSQYRDTKNELGKQLTEKFAKEVNDKTLSIQPDLTMRFLRAGAVFSSGSSKLPHDFEKTLDDVMPKYLDILVGLNDTLKANLKEIRIEGHTDRSGFRDLDADPYKANLILSQQRAREVLFHILKIVRHSNYSQKDKEMLEHLFTANGYSYSQALDSESNPIYDSKKTIDPEKSRRVEIKIVTNERQVIEKLINKREQPETI